MSKKVFFVTATNTDVGKSYACEKFLTKYAKDGYKVGYYKPIETGVNNNPVDGTYLLDITQNLNSDFSFDINTIVPYQFILPAAPYIAKETTSIDIDFIISNAYELLELCDILIVEGAGGLMVPIELDYYMIDLISKFKTEFDATTILISPSNLGSINDTILSQKALESYNIQYDWYINIFKDKDTFDSVTLPFYKDKFKNNLKFL